MAVVVVESPAKAKTINKYLGSDYTVLASFGHVRDLPPKDGSVDTEDGFAMKWEVASDSKKHIKAITDALKTDDTLILATDPDREGEAISWHLQEALAIAAEKGQDGAPRDLQRDHQGRRDRSDGPSARCGHGAGRGLPRAPRAGLSGGVQPVARAVAQAAGREIGGPGAVGLPAPDRRARDGDRGVPRPRILDRFRRAGHPARAGIHRAADDACAARSWTNSTFPTRHRPKWRCRLSLREH